MNGRLTDEAYARAALTYLAEPADRRLAQLIRVHGAAVTLAAIKSGRLLGPTGLRRQRGRPGDQGGYGAVAHPAAGAADAGGGARLRRVGDQAGVPG